MKTASVATFNNSRGVTQENVNLVQWNPVSTVTSGSKKISLYYRGRVKFHELMAVMKNTPYIGRLFDGTVVL